MKLNTYPKYKDSGVEWLGEVPEHWGINRLGYHFTQRSEIVSDKDYPALSVTKLGILPQLEHVAKTDAGDNRKLVKAGDYVINSRSDRKGSSGLSDLDGSVSLINIVLKPYQTIHPKFSHYLFRSVLFQEEFYKYGHGIVADLWTTNYSDMKLIALALPKKQEQAHIAAFLDHETARVDTLIAKQEQLIERLGEQRQSVISHAVTKGLNPDAAMKDSGVEWLGEMPDHWNLNRIDALSLIVRGNSAFARGDLKEEGKYVALQYGKTYQIDEVTEDFDAFVGQEFYKKEQEANYGDTILISTSETIEDLGHTCFYARKDTGLIGGEQFLLKPDKSKVLERYLFYSIRGLAKELQKFATGIKVYRFNSSDLKRLFIPTAPLAEQLEIITHIDSELSRISSLITKQKELIKKLMEYRSSVISYAVTGKINVRDYKGLEV